MRLLNKIRNIPHSTSKEVWGNVLTQIQCFPVVAQNRQMVSSQYIHIKTLLVLLLFDVRKILNHCGSICKKKSPNYEECN